MKTITTAFLALVILSPLPALAETHEYSPLANPKIPVTQGTPEHEELPMPSPALSNDDAEIVPASQKPYVQIDQTKLPYDPARAVVDDSITYMPGIEIPRGGKATKQINDQVPE